jgi:hypothetical protein
MSDELDELGADGVDSAHRTRAIEFPPAAIEEIRRHANQYLDELIRETERVAGRNRADHASPQHVQMAVDTVGSASRTRKEELLGAAGGAVFGAGLSAYAALLIVGSYPALGVAAATVLLVVGASLLAYELKR